MKKKQVLFSIGALALVGVLGVTTAASAFSNKNHDPEVREALKEAVENKDFAAWRALIPEDHPKLEKITEENFAEFVENHKGRFANGKQFRGKAHGNHRGFSKEDHQALRDALEARDYTSWSELVGDRKVGSLIDESNFDKFAEMHELFKAGDKDAAKLIAEELGLHKRGHIKNKPKV